MRFGIPVLQNRVAPRSTNAEAFVLLVLKGGRVTHLETIEQRISNHYDLIRLLDEYQIDTLICGGNSSDARKLISTLEISVIDNVACQISEAVTALEKGLMRPGYGFCSTQQLTNENLVGDLADSFGAESRFSIDCLVCPERKCFRNQTCHLSLPQSHERADFRVQSLMQAGIEVSLETEMVLCRIAELVYFILEMKYQKIGIAFCVDLTQQTTVLAAVLRRFVEVCCVCCRVRDIKENNTRSGSLLNPNTCNPQGQAAVLNRFGSELNVLVGLDLGMDCIFNSLSEAPVTTLFVKDKMLANNPVGAIYSDYYLSEIARHADLYEAEKQPLEESKEVSVS